MNNNDSPIVKGNVFIPNFKDRENKYLCSSLREVVFNSKIEEFVYVKNDDKPSHFENFSFTTFNIPKFPIRKVS